MLLNVETRINIKYWNDLRNMKEGDATNISRN